MSYKPGNTHVLTRKPRKTCILTGQNMHFTGLGMSLIIPAKGGNLLVFQGKLPNPGLFKMGKERWSNLYYLSIA